MAKYRVEQIAPHPSLTWALTERFRWSREVNDVLKKDADGALLKAAHDAVDWARHYARVKGTPFYDWSEEGGMLTFGGPYHIQHDCFFSGIGSTSTREEGWLKEHPEFNQVLHDIHVEVAGQMIDYILGHAPRKGQRKRRRKRSQRQKGHPAFKVGDSVVVKAGTPDPDLGIEIGGWQGRITAGPDTDGLVTISWDSLTLQSMPDTMIAACEQQGLDWTQMILEARAIEPCSPRDSESEVARVVDELSAKHTWSWLGEEGERIGKILAAIDPDDEMDPFYAWEEHLSEHLVFPFEAEVAEFQSRGPLRAGDRVKVTGVALTDDLYGVIVDLRYGRHKYAFPLCDLEVVDPRSPNYQLVRDYAVWFANR